MHGRERARCQFERVEVELAGWRAGGARSIIGRDQCLAMAAQIMRPVVHVDSAWSDGARGRVRCLSHDGKLQVQIHHAASKVGG
jgi:hypothetical protein